LFIEKIAAWFMSLGGVQCNPGIAIPILLDSKYFVTKVWRLEKDLAPVIFF